MYKRAVRLEIDDYLDLFNYAGKLNDQEWQKEISKKLKNFFKGNHNNKVVEPDHNNDTESVDAI